MNEERNDEDFKKSKSPKATNQKPAQKKAPKTELERLKELRQARREKNQNALQKSRNE